MGTFNPLAAVLRRNGQGGQPMIGQQGGVRQMPGAMPYQPNAVADVMSSIVPIINGVVAGTQQANAAKEQDTQQFVDVNLKHMMDGLTVDKQKLAQAMKKDKRYKDLAWDQSPIQQGAALQAPGVAEPQQPQAAPLGPDGAPSTEAAPAPLPQVGTEMQQLPGYQKTQAEALAGGGGVPPDRNFLQKLGGLVGLGGPKQQLDPMQSRAFGEIGSMVERVQQQQALAQQAERIKAGTEIAEAQTKREAANVGMRMLGRDPRTGQMLTQSEQAEAALQFARFTGKMDIKQDLPAMVQMVRNATGKEPDAKFVDQMGRAMIFSSVGADKQAESETKWFKEFRDSGMSAAEAMNAVEKLRAGEKPPLSAFNKQRVEAVLSYAEKLNTMYPAMVPEVRYQAQVLISQGKFEEAMKFAAGSAGPSAAQVDVQKEAAKLAIDEGRLRVEQQNANTNSRNASIREKELSFQRSIKDDQSIMQALTKSKDVIESVQKGDMTANQGAQMLKIIESTTGGNLLLTQTDTSGWFTRSTELSMGTKGAFNTQQGKSKAEQSMELSAKGAAEIGKFFTEKFYPALKSQAEKAYESQKDSAMAEQMPEVESMIQRQRQIEKGIAARQQPNLR